MPSAAKRRAIARPWPVMPPVMTAERPFNEFISSHHQITAIHHHFCTSYEFRLMRGEVKDHEGNVAWLSQETNRVAARRLRPFLLELAEIAQIFLRLRRPD